MTDRLDRTFFSRDPVMVAADLIGCRLVRVLGDQTLIARITETEAYGDETDLASHAAVYRVARGEVMRRPPGSLYVYLSYGIHHCLNVVAHEPGGAGAVLIRAVEPLSGFETPSPPDGIGPGRLTKLMNVDWAEDGSDVVASNIIWILQRSQPVTVEYSKRIGITRDTERLWRFFDADSEIVSPLPLKLRS